MSLGRDDPCSFSNPSDIIVRNLDLQLCVDFERHVLFGNVILRLERLNLAAKALLLDSRDLHIKSVTLGGTNLEFTVNKPVKSFGSKVEIQLPREIENPCKVEIEYETSPGCTALQWLSPEQTAGKHHPYLFSQCQAIHARSLVPCQDTPAVKATYSAKITVPKDLVALMSAVKKETLSKPGDDGFVVNCFEQSIPIPSYLLAIVVGALKSRDIGPKSKVWSEESTLELAAYEFAETEQMLSTASSLAGEYVWGVYDLLVLPPSFPYGGMENPCLTFVTPTLLAGDRSLANVVAHEIAHSWTGNLVTNKTWEHFWLNEGFTVFLERKIIGRMAGDEKVRHFKAIGGWNDLKYCVEEHFDADHAYTRLVPDLTGVDPDDAFSSVPYEKGSNLLMYLEQKLGGPSVFEPFLKAYIEKFKFKSLTTQEWKAFLYEYFEKQKSVLDSVDWETWFYGTGMPPERPQCDSSLRDVCTELAERWAVADDDSLSGFKHEDLAKFSPDQVLQFVAELLEKPKMSAAKIQALGDVYKLATLENSEIKFRWLRLCIKAGVTECIEKALRFVTEQGRMKFVRPIYRDLFNWETARQQAIDNYKQHSAQMHNLTATMVGKDLKLL